MQAEAIDLLTSVWGCLILVVVSALIGYGTNRLALWMIFQPVQFRGISSPFLGWRGIVPRRADKMASISVDTITGSLIDPTEIYARLDANRVADELGELLNNMVEAIVDHAMQSHQPELWASMPDAAKDEVHHRINQDMPEVVAGIMAELRTNIGQMYDLKDMAIASLTRDTSLLNRMFQRIGDQEFKRIALSGLYVGALVGVLQLIVWPFYPQWWLFPVFGLAAGLVTNWLALKLIFSPKEVALLGPIHFQGLFPKRQEEVAEEYGELLSAQIITPANIIEAVLRGPYADRIFHMISGHMYKVGADRGDTAESFRPFAVGTKNYIAMKNAAAAKIADNLPEDLKHPDSYAEDAMDLRNTLVARLKALSPEEFEGMLRPGFEQDAWVLLAVGAVLGFFVGVVELLVFIGT